MFIFEDDDQPLTRKFAITLPASAWAQLDEIVSKSESSGKRINVEASLSKTLADDIRRAAKRERRDKLSGV